MKLHLFHAGTPLSQSTSFSLLRLEGWSVFCQQLDESKAYLTLCTRGCPLEGSIPPVNCTMAIQWRVLKLQRSSFDKWNWSLCSYQVHWVNTRPSRSTVSWTPRQGHQSIYSASELQSSAAVKCKQNHTFDFQKPICSVYPNPSYLSSLNHASFNHFHQHQLSLS